MLDLCSLGKENGPWGRDREIWGGDAQKDNSERAHGLSGRPGSFFRGRGRKVFSCAPNSAQDILELEKGEEKREIPHIQRIGVHRVIFRKAYELSVKSRGACELRVKY